MTYRRYAVTMMALTVLLVLLALACLVFGSVDIPVDRIVDILSGKGSGNKAWDIIILQSRIPMIATAALAGAALSISGLLLQTTFRNPLAGPSILGITNGASVGVAVVMLITGGIISLGGNDNSQYSILNIQFIGSIAVVIGAFIGSLLIIFLLLAVSSVIKNSIMLLIVGIMVSYLASSVVMLLNIFANADNLHSYVMWGRNLQMKSGPYFSRLRLYQILV